LQVVEKVLRQFEQSWSGSRLAGIRGIPQGQPEFLTRSNLDAAVPAHHPLRAVQRQIDAVLRKLSPLWDELVEERGRPSIPP
jgi:hypothetical protein